MRRSAQATKTVSSPAIVPTTSGHRARSSAAAMAWADPGSVMSTSSQAGLANLHGQVVEQAPQPFLAGRLGLRGSVGQRVDRDALAARLDQPQLGHVTADRGLRRPEAALAQGRRQLLLGPDRPPLDAGRGSPAGGAAS